MTIIATSYLQKQNFMCVKIKIFYYKVSATSKMASRTSLYHNNYLPKNVKYYYSKINNFKAKN